MAVAINTWLGSTSAVPTVVANWSQARLPEAGDFILFDGTASGACDGADLSAAQVASITITRDCTIDIGTSITAPLIFDCAGPVIDEGAGAVFLKADNTTSWLLKNTGSRRILGLDNAAIVVDSPGATIVLGPDPQTATEFDTVTVLNGDAAIKNLLAQDGAAAFNLFMTGGEVECFDSVDDAKIVGGKYTQRSEGINNLWLRDATLNYNSTTKIDGTAILENAAVLDASGSSGFIIDATTMYPESKIIDPLGVITYTAAITFEGQSVTVE